jgi:RNA polymerase sigma-70 factor (ECF subfamily)
MVTGAALCDPEGGLLEEAGRQESPATHATQPERNAAQPERTAAQPERTAQEAERDAQEAQRNAQEAQRNAQEAQRNAQEAQRNAQEAQRNAQEAQWSLPTWEDIVRTHSARVYRLAYRLTGNQHDAEDLTQEVFVRVFRSLSSYTPGTFEGWLHRITTNLFLDSARRKQRIRFEGLADEMTHRLAGSEPTPAQAFDDSHLDDDVQAALKALPPEYRAAVVLCDIEGFSYEEIAATLGVKLGTVRSRIHRGRAQLRSALEHRRRGPVAVSHGPVDTAVSNAASTLAASTPAASTSAASTPAGNEAARGLELRRQGLVPRRLKRAGEP